MFWIGKIVLFKCQDCWTDRQPNPSLPRPLSGHLFPMDLSWTPDLFFGPTCWLPLSLTHLHPSFVSQQSFSHHFPLSPAPKILLATISLVLENSSYIAWMFLNVMPSLFCFVFPLLFYQLLPGWSHPFLFFLAFSKLLRIPDSYLQYRSLWWVVNVQHMSAGVSNAPQTYRGNTNCLTSLLVLFFLLVLQISQWIQYLPSHLSRNLRLTLIFTFTQSQLPINPHTWWFFLVIPQASSSSPSLPSLP